MNLLPEKAEWDISFEEPEADMIFALSDFAGASIEKESDVEALASFCETAEVDLFTVMERVSPFDIDETLLAGR